MPARKNAAATTSRARAGGETTVLATVKDNVVTLNDQSKLISSIHVPDASVVVTDGQSYKLPVSVKKTKEASQNVWTLTLQAGRENSSPVAKKFNKAAGGSAHEFADGKIGEKPEKLNFFFEAVLQIEAAQPAFVNLYLGQGHYGTTNNWWMGGEALNYMRVMVGPFPVQFPVIDFSAGDQKYRLPLSGGTSSFTLSKSIIPSSSPIRTVFVLMLENHSFDNVFAFSGIKGLKVATPADTNTYKGNTYPVHSYAPSAMPTDPGHEFEDVVEQLAGPGAKYTPHGAYPKINNSGFVANYATSETEGPRPSPPDYPAIMGCFQTATQLPILYKLATEFAVCDQWYSSLPGPTWPNRFFLHGASSNGLATSPTKGQMAEWESVDGFTYPHGSIFDALTAAGVSWRLYNDQSTALSGSVPQVASLKHINVTDVDPLGEFAKELRKNPYPYQYVFIEPNYGDVTNGSYEDGSSQHPKDGMSRGEGLIKYVYESIRNSPVWDSSMLIITYDEHGGFYDSVAPPAAPPPNDGSSNKLNKPGFTFAQYGVRVPAVVVSPWISRGVVDPTLYDHASVLATLEALFGVEPLTNRDRSANNLLTLVTSTKRTDAPKTLEGAPALDLRRKPVSRRDSRTDSEPIPKSGNLVGVLGILLKEDIRLSGGGPAARAACIARFERIETRGDARKYIERVLAKVQAARARRRR